eukprot:6815818-Alexandrium_andersonii.AAC.1
MGPEPTFGWNKSRHGIGVPFRPGVPRPQGSDVVIASYGRNGQPIYVSVHGAGTALITALRQSA